MNRFFLVGGSQIPGLALLLISAFLPWMTASKTGSYVSAKAELYPFVEGFATGKVELGLVPIESSQRVPALVTSQATLYILLVGIAVVAIGIFLSFRGKQIGAGIGILGAVLALIPVAHAYANAVPIFRQAQVNLGLPGANLALVGSLLLIGAVLPALKYPKKDGKEKSESSRQESQ